MIQNVPFGLGCSNSDRIVWDTTLKTGRDVIMIPNFLIIEEVFESGMIKSVQYRVHPRI